MKLDWSKVVQMEKFLAALQIVHECKMCGSCCVNMAGIAYNSTDTVRMAKTLGIPRNEFVKEYTIASTKQPKDRWLNTKGKDHECIFWSKNGCTKYEGRGQVCRLYPWTSPEQLNSVKAKKGWHIYPKCRGMQETYLKVLEAAKKMPLETAQAILKSPLGNICMLNLIRDMYNEESALFSAKELGLPHMPAMEELKSMAWNYAVACVTLYTPQRWQQDFEMISTELAKWETT
jgi:Fe-S-cluster containining protein